MALDPALQARIAALAKVISEKQSHGMGMLGGKAAAQGETYMTGPEGISGSAGLYNTTAASQAFDATQNIRESELEDLRQRALMAQGRK